MGYVLEVVGIRHLAAEILALDVLRLAEMGALLVVEVDVLWRVHLIVLVNVLQVAVVVLLDATQTVQALVDKNLLLHRVLAVGELVIMIVGVDAPLDVELVTISVELVVMLVAVVLFRVGNHVVMDVGQDALVAVDVVVDA